MALLCAVFKGKNPTWFKNQNQDVAENHIVRAYGLLTDRVSSTLDFVFLLHLKRTVCKHLD